MKERGKSGSKGKVGEKVRLKLVKKEKKREEIYGDKLKIERKIRALHY